MPIRSREEYFGCLESDSDSDIEKEEYIIEFDEEGNIIKIPYDPFDENWFEDYKKLIEEKKRMEETKELALADNNLVEVEKLEEAEYLLIVHKNPIPMASGLTKIDRKFTYEEIKKEEKRDNGIIYFVKKVE